MHAAIQEFRHELEHLQPDAAETQREHVRAQGQHHAHLRFGKRGAHAAGVAADEIQLQLPQVATFDVDLGKLPEPGVYAVDDRVSGRDLLDHAARGVNALVRRRGDRDWRPVDCHAREFSERKGLAG